MADHGHTSHSSVTGMDAHRATYEGFLKGSVGLGLISLYVLVALVTFRFVSYPMSMLLGFGGIIVGIIAALVGLRAGGKWAIPGGLLVLYALFVAANVHL